MRNNKLMIRGVFGVCTILECCMMLPPSVIAAPLTGVSDDAFSISLAPDAMPSNRFTTPHKDYLALQLPSPPALPVPPRPPHPHKIRPRGYHQRYFRHGPSLYGGFTRGGDTLAQYSGDKLKAGDGYSFHFGWNTDFKTGPSRVAIQWALGYRWSEMDGVNNSVVSETHKMSVIPFDALVYFQQGLFRVGGGLTYHLFPSYTIETESQITGSSERTIDFDNQLGFTASMEIVGIRAPFFLNFRYTYVIYTPTDGAYPDSDGNLVDEVNGSHFGIYAGLHIR